MTPAAGGLDKINKESFARTYGIAVPLPALCPRPPFDRALPLTASAL